MSTQLTDSPSPININMAVDTKSLAESTKMKVEQIDNKQLVDEEDGKPNRDYAGAAAKTDPAEIRLVRKLDRRILPTLFIMYFLNYVDSKLHILDQIYIDIYIYNANNLSKRKCYCTGPS